MTDALVTADDGILRSILRESADPALRTQARIELDAPSNASTGSAARSR